MSRSLRRSRLVGSILVAGALATAVAVGAGAAGARTARATAAPSVLCGYESYSQPFLRWNDPRNYTLFPGGSMESRLTGWTLASAKIVRGNETYYVHSSSDRYSLALGSSGSARTPAVCVGPLNPALRLFVQNTGSSAGRLRVEVFYTDAQGAARTAVVARLSGASQWQPSPVVMFLDNLAPKVGGDGTTPVSFRFAAEDGSWRIDDVYLDPKKAR